MTPAVPAWCSRGAMLARPMADGQSETRSGHRVRAARLGASARSPYLLAAAGLFALAGGSAYAGELVLDPLRALFALVFAAVRDGADPLSVLRDLVPLLLRVLATPLAAVFVAVLLAGLAQVTPRFGPLPARASGGSGLFSPAARLGTAGTALLGATIVLCVAAVVLSANVRGLFDLARRAPADAASLFGAALAGFTGWMVAVLVLVGLADLVRRRVGIARALRMTRRELDQTLRETRGDPGMRARRRAEHAALGRETRSDEAPTASRSR